MLSVVRRLAPRASLRQQSSVPKPSFTVRSEAHHLGRSLSSFRGIHEDKDNVIPVRTSCLAEDWKNGSTIFKCGVGFPNSSDNWTNGKYVATTTTSGHSLNLVTVAAGLRGSNRTCLSPAEGNSVVTIADHGTQAQAVNTCEDFHIGTYTVKSHQRPQGFAQRHVETLSQNGARQLKHDQSFGFALEQSSAFNRRSFRIRRLAQQQQVAFFSSEPDLRKDSKDNNVESDVPNKSNWVTTTNRPRPSLTLGPTPVPTPKSPPEAETNPLAKLTDQTPKNIARKGIDLLISAARTVVTFLMKLPGNIFFYATHPKELSEGYCRLRDIAKHEAHHYWVGTKLLWADIQTARKLLGKTLEGSSLTRRERKQLLRTVSDLFRLIPFSMFVIIPFMEFALPFALRIFPNMLPSTYQDSLKAEESMKRELKSRIAMASFFQE